jgi:hypothetical protein
LHGALFNGNEDTSKVTKMMIPLWFSTNGQDRMSKWMQLPSLSGVEHLQQVLQQIYDLMEKFSLSLSMRKSLLSMRQSTNLFTVKKCTNNGFAKEGYLWLTHANN